MVNTLTTDDVATSLKCDMSNLGSISEDLELIRRDLADLKDWKPLKLVETVPTKALHPAKSVRPLVCDVIWVCAVFAFVTLVVGFMC